MSVIKKDTIEVWYFKTKLQMEKRETIKAVGYEKVVDGVLKKKTGVVTKHPWIRSNTIVRKK